jgi:hypothetical protein
LQGMRNYLHLHWTLVAIRTKNMSSILKIIDISILSFEAWRLLILAALVRRSHYNNFHLRKFVLIR